MSLRIGSILNWKRLAATPSETVGSSEVLTYAKSDGNLYTKDDSGVESVLMEAGFVRAATTGGITLSGTQTIDGVALGVGDRVLVQNQGVFSGNAYDNGIWTVAAGAWSRSPDANTSAKIAGRAFTVTEGTFHIGQRYRCDFLSTNVLGTDTVTFTLDQGRLHIGGVFGQPQISARAPGSTYFIAGERRLLIWDGTFFSNVKGVSNYGSVVPAFPAAGEIWLDSSVTNANATANPFFKGKPVSRSQAVTVGVNIPFTASEDTHSAWNAASNYYVVPVSGLYRMVGQIKVDGTNTHGSLALTNSAGLQFAWSPNVATTAFGGSQIELVARFVVGDTIALHVQNTDALQDDGATVENAWFIIEYVRA